ncbi:venom serine carboxypeptidase-like [Dermacentor albipictus]|uniref:venom serine carboxypeptidase-like n=1 Tax=Dermacentor albipictus TaxID=60249 RepID=UPI0038FC357B
MHSSVWIFVVLAAGLQHVHGSDENSPLFLTPYINASDYETAKNLSQVKIFQKLANVSAYSGLITVNSVYNSSLFFLFVVAEGNRNDAPILLWTQGGPGLSSLFGEFLENGPIAYDPISNFSLRSNTLQKNMSVIYLDVPVGTGFSITEDLRGFSTKLEDITEHVIEFLRQFFKLFSEFENRDFYLAGESYGARYSVAIAHQLLTDNKKLPLKLKGISGGNGFLGPVLDTANSAEFLYHTSMLDDIGRMQFELRFQYMKNLTITNITIVPLVLLSTIFTDPTKQQPTFFQNVTLYNDHASPLYTERPFHMLACFVFLNTSSALRREIHVGENARFQYANRTLIGAFASDWLRDITNLTQRVLNETRVLFYTGQLDALFPAVNQRTYFSSLKWAHAEKYQSSSRVPWRPPTWNPYMGYAGFMKRAANFTDIVVLGMSHYGAAEKPDEAYHLITQFVADKLEASVSQH